MTKVSEESVTDPYPDFTDDYVGNITMHVQNVISIGSGFIFHACATSRAVWTKDDSAIWRREGVLEPVVHRSFKCPWSRGGKCPSQDSKRLWSERQTTWEQMCRETNVRFENAYSRLPKQRQSHCLSVGEKPPQNVLSLPVKGSRPYLIHGSLGPMSTHPHPNTIWNH